MTNMKKREFLEDLSVDGGDIRMNLKETGWECVEWIHLT
jgi:hypothetical protein